MGTTFEEIYTPKNRQHVIAVCKRILRNPADVEDAAQDVFISAFQALPRFESRNGASVATWLCVIARNKALNYIRQHSRATLVSLEDSVTEDSLSTFADVLPAQEVSPEVHAFLREALGHAMKAVNALPSSLRVPLLMKLEGFSEKEIGAAVGILSVCCIKSRIYHARKRLRERVHGTHGQPGQAPGQVR